MGIGERVRGSRFKVQGSRFEVQKKYSVASGSWQVVVQSSRFKVQKSLQVGVAVGRAHEGIYRYVYNTEGSVKRETLNHSETGTEL